MSFLDRKIREYVKILYMGKKTLCIYSYDYFGTFVNKKKCILQFSPVKKFCFLCKKSLRKYGRFVKKNVAAIMF